MARFETQVLTRPENLKGLMGLSGTRIDQTQQRRSVALSWRRLSSRDFVDNQVRLQLFVLAYNLGNFLRRPALPTSVKHWTPTTLRNKLVKIGTKVVHHARRVVFQMAEVAIRRPLLAAVLRRIERLRLLTPRPK